MKKTEFKVGDSVFVKETTYNCPYLNNVPGVLVKISIHFLYVKVGYYAESFPFTTEEIRNLTKLELALQ